MKSNQHGFRKQRWLLGLCMALVLLVTACSGKGEGDKTGASHNGNASGTPNAETGDPYDALPKKVSISMFDRGQVSSDEGTYEENRWVDWIRKQSGIEVSIVPVPRNQAQDTLNVLIASAQAPDLIWEYDRTYIGKLVTQGVLQPIGDYIDKYSTSYKKYLEANPELLPHLTFDGEMYAVASKRSINTIANHAMWIRQDWLDELNLKAPTTIDELISVAEAFKEHYPDSTPIVGANAGDIYAALYGAINSQWYLEDGKMTYGATLDRFSDVIALQKNLYDKGLIDKEYFTDSNNQRANQLWTTGKSGILLAQWGGGSMDIMMKDLISNVPDSNPVPLEAVATPYGKYGTYQESEPFIYVAFNKDMKNPKAAVEYLDWMVDSGWFTLLNGEEGVHYELASGIPKRLDADKFTKEVLYASEYAVLRQEDVKPEDLILQAESDELSQRIAKLKSQSLETALKNEFRRDIPYQPTFDEISEIRSTFDTFLKETLVSTITQGPGYTAEKAKDDIRKEWKRLGGEQADQLAQQWYTDNKANFK
jgi:putative aldouronate transport system substrate-binding protein